MGTVKKEKEAMTTIQVKRSVAAQLQGLGKWGDTYSTIIERLLNGSKGDAHEDRGVAGDEHTGDRDQETG